MEKQQEEQHQSPKFPLPPVDSYHGSGVGSFVRHTAFTYTIVYLKACRSLLLKFYWFLQYFRWSSWSSNAFLTPTLLLAYKFYWYLPYFGKSRWSNKAFFAPALLLLCTFYWYLQYFGESRRSSKAFFIPMLFQGYPKKQTTWTIVRHYKRTEALSPHCNRQGMVSSVRLRITCVTCAHVCT